MGSEDEMDFGMIFVLEDWMNLVSGVRVKASVRRRSDIGVWWQVIR